MQYMFLTGILTYTLKTNRLAYRYTKSVKYGNILPFMVI